MLNTASPLAPFPTHRTRHRRLIPASYRAVAAARRTYGTVEQNGVR